MHDFKVHLGILGVLFLLCYMTVPSKDLACSDGLTWEASKYDARLRLCDVSGFQSSDPLWSV